MRAIFASPKSHEQKTSNRFDVMDGLRGLAALAVLFGHVPVFGAHVTGLFAVDLFFVLSGFVIAHAYDLRLKFNLSVANFIKIRLIRLWPLFALGTVLGAFALVLRGRVVEMHHFLGLLMIPRASGNDLFPLDPVAWSLMFEVAINLLYAFTWRQWTIPRLAVFLPLATAALIGVGYHFNTFDVGWNAHTAFGGLARVCFGFPLGVLIHRAFRQGLLNFRLHPTAPLALSLMIFLIPSWLNGFAAHVMVMVLLVPLTVVCAVTSKVGMLQAPLKMLGDLSYSLYAMHLPVLWLIAAARPLFGFSSQATLLLFATIPLLTAWVAHHHFDIPVRRLLTARFGR